MVVCNLKGTKLLCLKSVIFGQKCIAFHYFWQIFTIKCIYLVRLIKICYFLVFTTFAYSFFFKWVVCNLPSTENVQIWWKFDCENLKCVQRCVELTHLMLRMPFESRFSWKTSKNGTLGQNALENTDAQALGWQAVKLENLTQTIRLS